MKTAKYIFLLPLILTGCLSTGSGSSSPGTHSPRDPNSSSGSNKPSIETTLTTFIDTEKFTNDVIASNNANIRKAFETAKLATNETNINIATEALKANIADTKYISSKIAKLTDVIESYDSNYTPKLTTFNKSQTSYIPLYYDGKYTPRVEAESDDTFAERLKLVIQNRYAVYGTVSSDKYIEQTLCNWATDIKNILGNNGITVGGKLDEIETQFLTLYNQLRNSINTATTEYDTAKSELFSKIKVMDSSITDFPLSLEALMNYYKLEQNILNAIGSVEYINPPTATNTEYTAISLYDTTDKKSVKFEYNEDTKDYSLVLTDIGTGTNHQANRTVKLQPSDFIATSGYYKAEKTTPVGEKTSTTYFPNLKNYITAGGTLDVLTRKTYATNIIKKVLYNSAPTETDIADFNKWFGSTLGTDSALSDELKVLAELAIKILSKTDSNFDITKTNNVTDIVKLGGKSLALSYSDFGLWTIKGSAEYSGDKDLITAINGTDTKSSYYIDNSFYSGLDEFKAGFQTKSDSEINSKTSFIGKTIASASKDEQRKDLTGTAKLNIDNQTAKGDIDLSFDSWYGFTFGNVDFSSDKGFSLKDTAVTVSGKALASDIQITSTPDTIKGNVAGALYGPTSTTPIEGVGTYNITTGDSIKIDGAFGVKK